MDAVLAAARRTGGLEIVIPGQDAPGAGPPDPV
jgi:hypothetical protein